MSKKWIILLILITFVVIGLVVVDQLTAVKPAWPEPREGESIPPRPAADDPPFHQEPFADSYEERKQAYLEWAAKLEMPETRGGMYINMAQMMIDSKALVADAPLRDALNHVNQRNDTADFATSGLMRLYYGFPERLTPEQKEAMEETDNRRPSYWASSGRLPRTAQHENVLVALHDIDRRPSPSIFEARHYAFTHAYFPRWAFDEVVETEGWNWILQTSNA